MATDVIADKLLEFARTQAAEDPPPSLEILAIKLRVQHQEISPGTTHKDFQHLALRTRQKYRAIARRALGEAK